MFFSFCILFSLLIHLPQDFAFSSSTRADVEDLFPASIYDQRSLYEMPSGIIVFRTGVNRLNIQEKARDLLRKKKRDIFHQECISPLEGMIFKLRSLLTAAEIKDKRLVEEHVATEKSKESRGLWGGIVSGIGAVTSAAAEFIPGAKLGHRIVSGIGSIISGVGTSIKSATQAAQNFIERPSPETRRALSEQIEELERDKAKLIKFLSRDSFAGFDEFYVQKKWTFPTDFQARIEEALVQSKRSSFQAAQYRQFLQYALTVPVAHKKISSEGLNEKFLLDPVFKNYTDPLKADLLRVAHAIARNSQTEGSSGPVFPLREVCYFFGDPGNGKSTAAETLARLLGLAYFKTNIRSAQDLSQSSLEGSGGVDGNPGWFVEALLASISITTGGAGSGVGIEEPADSEPIMEAIKHSVRSTDLRMVADVETYSNGFLIINDFDRILLDPYASTTALAFFLEYLDTDKKDFKSPYFKYKLPINRLNIIITGNHPIPSDPKFDALRDRLTEIPFPPVGPGAFDDVIMRSIRGSSAYGALPVGEQEALSADIMELKRRKGLSFRGIKRSVKNRAL